MICLLLLFGNTSFAEETKDAALQEREQVEAEADEKLDELREENEAGYNELMDAMGTDYETDLFDDDDPTNGFDRFVTNLNRASYKLRVIVMKYINLIAGLFIGLGLLMIIAFKGSVNKYAFRGLMLAFGMTTFLIVYTYYPLVKLYVGF